MCLREWFPPPADADSVRVDVACFRIAEIVNLYCESMTKKPGPNG